MLVTQISSSSTILTIWCWKSNLVSFTAWSGISGLSVVVCIRLTKPILQKRLCVELEETTSIHFKCSSELFWISACAAAIATTEFKTPPFCLKINKKFLTFSSTEPSIRGRPRFDFDNSVFLLFDFNNSSYFFLRLLAVLSPSLRWGWDFLNFVAAAVAHEWSFIFPYHDVLCQLV